MENIKFKAVKNVAKEITHYQSDVIEEGFAKYIILKNKKGYNAYEFHYKTDCPILTLDSLINCYKGLWTGFKTLKDAKDYIKYEL